MRYFIFTYGCQMNKSDSERIASILENIGYQPASNENEADLILVNMCSVRQSAVDRVYGLSQKLSKLKIKNKKLKAILTGCILTEDRKKFAKKFDLILDIKNLSYWPKNLKNENSLICLDQINKSQDNYLKIQPKYQSNFLASVPISNGCNNFCSYCVVPYVRGSLACRDHREILDEVQKVVKNDFREIWLLGQNVNDYQSPIDKKINFVELLRMVNDIPGNFWIRFTSPNPANFSDELIEVMANCEKVTKYLNLPAQSGDNQILKKMNRPYTVGQYKNLVKKIRKKVPDINLSTDIIVGFPGETKKQFENTLKLFKEIKFDMAYIAKYSPRAGTAATKLRDNVPYQEKEKRYKILTEILKKTALENNKKYINKIVDVLPEYEKNEWLIGKTKEYKTIKIQNPNFNFKNKSKIQNSKLIGKFVKVKVLEAQPWGLKGIKKG